jgi:hypothetical protein
MRGAKCKPKHLLADGFMIKELDIKTITTEELQVCECCACALR